MKSPLFERVQVDQVKSNVFDLGHEKKLSCNMGQLIPILVQEVIPGDKFKCNTEIMMRLAPMISPIMHRVNVFTHYFFVPNRLIWDSWEDFITGGKDGLQAPAVPYLAMNDARKANIAEGGLWDQMGLPPYIAGVWRNTTNVSALPFRAYQLIYDTYYRDQKLSTEIGCVKTSGEMNDAETAKLCALRMRSWEKDYFTSALTSPQLGGPASLTVGGHAAFVPSYLKPAIGYNLDDTTAAAGGVEIGGAGIFTDVAPDPIYIANLNSGDLPIHEAIITANDLRRVFKLQVWLEKNMRAGWRYVEQILSHFGVRMPDRNYRVQYLGGGKQPIVISEVLNTSSTATEPQGNMAGHGISVGNQNYFQENFNEHGWVLGIMSVLPRTAYMQGIDKSFLKFDKFDYYFPEFATLGEQEVVNREIYMDWDEVYDPAATFGYQSRYAEYKFKQSQCTGQFRSSLDHWHMTRKFASLPLLNASFVESNPTHHIFAVETETIPKLYVQIYNDLKAIRKMPVFGTPEL